MSYILMEWFACVESIIGLSSDAFKTCLRKIALIWYIKTIASSRYVYVKQEPLCCGIQVS